MAGFTPLPPQDGAVLRSRAHGVGGDVVAVLEALWRRKWIPVITMLSGLCLGFAALIIMPPLYKASAQVMVDAHDTRNGVLQSEVAIAGSTPVLSKVAGQLGLFRDREFTAPRLADRVLLQRSDENAQRDRVMERLTRMIDVHVIPNTSIIDMSVHNKNPDRAAQIANALLSSYQERKVDERFEQSRQINSWMSKRLEEIRGDSQDAKQRLSDFQSAHGQMFLQQGDGQAQRMAQLSQDMAAAQNDIAALTQRLIQAQGKPVGNQVMLKKREAALKSELLDLQKRYGDKHPKIIEQKADIAKIQAALKKQPVQDVSALDHDLKAAKLRVDGLQAQISEVLTHADVDGTLRTELKNLESEVSANDRLYSDFLIKYQDMMANTEMQMTDIKVVGMATIPSHPDQRARFAMLAVLAIAGFVLGLIYVLLCILWATGFTSAVQLETMTGYPVFAAIPAAKTKHDGEDSGAVHHNVLQDPAAILAESLRTLRVSLRLRGEVGHRPRVIAFTSTLPNEGKTSLSVMLAMIAAKSGERVCVVDCDLRRPSLHKAFGIGNAKGVADYLSDRLGAEDVIYRKDPSGVHLITAKAVPSYSLTLLTSGRMERLIENLREQYDLVILDAPSSLAFSDARVLARMVDQTLYVVAWNRTRRESVMASLKAYADMGYADLALVLNKVDLSEYLRDSAAAVVYQYGREVGPEFAT